MQIADQFDSSARLPLSRRETMTSSAKRRLLERATMSSATESKGEHPLPVPKTGRSFPIGATLLNGGANFSVFSRSAVSIELLLFDRVDDARPPRVIPMDPSANRTYHYWHVYVPGLQEGQIYGFRAFGPFEPDRGLRFDPSKLLLDPYGRAISVPRNYSCEAARLEGDNAATAMKSVLADSVAILGLPDFDRLAFVICVLERYSILDCALLLKRSPKEVNDARVRAINQVVSAEERNRHESATTFPTSPYGSCSNGIGEFDGSCGSLLD